MTNERLALVLSHTSITALGIQGIHSHKFCPLCGEAMEAELRRRLGCFMVIDGGGLHGPICEACSYRFVPSLAALVEEDSMPKGRTTSGPSLESVMSRKAEEFIGYTLLPILELEEIEIEELDSPATPAEPLPTV